MKSKINTLVVRSYEFNTMTANVKLNLNNQGMKLIESFSGFSMSCAKKDIPRVLAYCISNVFANWTNIADIVKFNNSHNVLRTDRLQSICSALLILDRLRHQPQSSLSGSILTDTLPPLNRIYFPDNKFIKGLPKLVLIELVSRSALYTLSINGKAPIYFRPFNTLITKGKKSRLYNKAHKHIISNGEKKLELEEDDCCDKCGNYVGDSFWKKLKRLFV